MNREEAMDGTVLVCGGRDLDSMEVSFFLNELSTNMDYEIKMVIHGGAKGADHGASIFCMVNDIPCEPYPADWNTHGKGAGPIRNQKMLDDGKPSLCIAFWDGSSRGTFDMFSRCIKAGVPVQLIPAELVKTVRESPELDFG